MMYFITVTTCSHFIRHSFHTHLSACVVMTTTAQGLSGSLAATVKLKDCTISHDTQMPTHAALFII